MRLVEQADASCSLFKLARAMLIDEAAHFGGCPLDFRMSRRVRRSLLRKREVNVVKPVRPCRSTTRLPCVAVVEPLPQPVNSTEAPSAQAAKRPSMDSIVGKITRRGELPALRRALASRAVGLRSLSHKLYGQPPPTDAPKSVRLRYVRGIQLRMLPFALPAWVFLLVVSLSTWAVIVVAVGLLNVISLSVRIRRAERHESA
jgi:hypothetical protein